METFFRLMEYFLNHPYEEIHLRALAKKVRMSPSAAKAHADTLVREGLLQDVRKANLRILKANAASILFKHIKISYSLRFLLASGMVRILLEQIPTAISITLFRSEEHTSE